MKKFFVLVCACTLLASCGNRRDTNKNETAAAVRETAADPVASSVRPANKPDMHNAANALDYFGTYKGTLPAASGPGIETTLTLNKDMTFNLHTVYIGEKDGTFDEKGTYSIDQNIITLDLPDEKQYYKAGENRLWRLDMDKQMVTGPLADYYILKKAN